MSNYLKKLLFFSIIIISTLSAFSQDYFVETTFPTTGINRFSVCGGEREITVKLTNISSATLSNNTITFNLPQGFDYSAGTLSGTGVSELDTLIPSFSFGNVASGAVVEFTIKVAVLCSGIANATGSANTTFGFDLEYNGQSGSQTYVSPFFEVTKPTLSVTKIDGINSTSPDPFNAAKYNPNTKCVTIANGGNGALSSFQYWVVNHPQLEIDSVSIDGYGLVPLSYSNGDTSFFNITTAMLAFADPYTGNGADPNNTSLFQFNETIEICEHWNVFDCSVNPPDLVRGAQYKCQATFACESAFALQGVRFGYTRPDLKLGWDDTFGDSYPVCTGDTLMYYGAYITNFGNEAATDLRFSIYVGADQWGGTFLDTSTIQFSTSSKYGPYFKHEIGYTEMLGGIKAECLESAGPEAEAIRRASFFMDDLLLMPGDTLFIKFGYRVGCNCGDINLNDCSRILNSRDYRRIIYGYYNPAEPNGDGTTSYMNTGGSINYKDACEQFSYNENYIITSAHYYYYNTNGEGQGGTLEDDQESTVTFQGTSNLSTLAFHGSYFNCQDCFTEYYYIFPQGVDWAGSSGDLNTSKWTFVDQTGDLWIPDIVDYTDNQGGEDTLRIRLIGAPPSGFSVNANSLFYLDYKIDCSETSCGFYSGLPIKEETYFSLSGGACGSCGEKGDQVDCQESIPITFICPCNTSCEDGLVFKDLNAERRTFGKADNNNNTISSVGETLDTSLMLLHRVIPGDTVKVTFKGSINATNFSGFDYAFAEINFPATIDDFTPVGANVKIYDVSTNSVYSCDVLQQFVDGQKIVTNLSSANLKNLGCSSIPTNWQYQDGDSLTVEVYFMTKTNVGGNIVPLVYSTSFYVSDEDYGGEKYQCNPRDFLLSHVGYAFECYRHGTYNIKGCNENWLDVRHRIRVGSSWDHRAGADLFPYEVREPFKPGIVKIVNDSDLRFTENVMLRYYPLLVNNPGGYNSNYIQVTIDFSNPHVTVVGDTVIFDVENYMEEFSGDQISADQGFYFVVYVGVQASCKTEISTGYDKLYTYQVQSNANPKVTGSPTYECEYIDVKDVTVSEKPNLVIQVAPKTKQIIENPTCFSLEVVNAGEARADNVFWAFNDFNGSVIIESLTETTNGISNVITPTDLGIYQIGTLNQSSTRTFSLCVSSNNCALDSMKISTGWDCLSYPASLEEAECGESEKIYLQPVESELGMVISKPLTITNANLCDQIEYEVTLSSADIGSLIDIMLYFNLPNNMNFVNGSMQILYPVTGSYISIGDPTLTAGGAYIMKVTDQHPTLAEKGLPGTLNIGSNIVKVKFLAEAQCNYSSGSRPRFLSWAYDPCGKFANYKISPAPRHYINGVSDPFASSITLDNTELNACNNEQSTLNISISLASNSQATGAGDSVSIELPEGIYYVNNSYTPISNAVSTAPSVDGSSGSQTLYIDLQDGITSGNTIQFSIKIEAEDIGQACRDYDLIIQTYNSQLALCSSTNTSCNIRVVSSETTKNVTLEKPSYEITWGDINTVPNGVDSVSMAYSVNVENLSNVGLDANSGIIIEIYKDEDGDGRFTPADTKIGYSYYDDAIGANTTIILTDTITVAADQVCNLLAVINPNSSCTCGEDESFLKDANLINVFDREKGTCSTEEITFGPTQINGYTYQWIGLNGADEGALSSTTSTPVDFEFDNNTGSTLVWEYVLRTVQDNNCYSFDTMKVTVYPEIDNAGSVATCAGFPVNMSAPGGTVGSWSPATNLVDPTDPNTTMTGATEAVTYTWTYTDNQGCEAFFRMTISLTGCASSTMIGDYVWRDNNRNNIQDAGDTPLENVPVYLYDADDTTIPLALTYTDANGYYQFKPIPAGNYRIGFGNPYDYDYCVQDAGSDDELDSDMDTTTLVTEPILIANGDSITTVDAGFKPMQKIGDYVWADKNNNGIQNDDELPIPGVTVKLYLTNGTLLYTTTTNANGEYKFRVEPGSYYLVFDASTNTGNKNYEGVGKNIGGNPEKDSDANALTGQTDNFTIVAGVNRLDLDAGFLGVEDCFNGVDDDDDGDTDCFDSDCAAPDIDTVTFINTSCPVGTDNGLIMVTAYLDGNIIQYKLNDGNWQSSSTFTNLASGNYTVYARRVGGGCISEYPYTITLSTPDCVENCMDGIDNDGDGDIDCADTDCKPTITSVTSNQATCPCGSNNGSITINATGNILSYSIDNGITYYSVNVINNLSPGSYNVIVKSANGSCTTAYDSNPIIINDPNCVEICNNNIDDDCDGNIDCDDNDCKPDAPSSIELD